MCEMLPAKSCKRCSVEKPITEFHRQPSGVKGRHSWCKPCVNEYARATRKRLKRPYELRRWMNIKTKYGITEAEYGALMEAQGGMCAICQADLERPKIDHDHETGEVRGLLCHRCNLLLAGLEDLDFRERAMSYLSSTGGSPASRSPSLESA